MFAFGQAAHAILVPQKGMELMPPEVQMQSPNHWTTREVSYLIVVLIYTSLKTIVLSIVSCAYISFGEKFIKTFCFFLKLGCLFYCCIEEVFMGFPGGSQVRNPPANSGDWGSNPGSGSSPGEGHGNPPQYSCLANATD